MHRWPLIFKNSVHCKTSYSVLRSAHQQSSISVYCQLVVTVERCKVRLTTDCAEAAGACTVALCSISSAALVNVRCIRLVRLVLLLLLIVGLLLPLYSDAGTCVSACHIQQLQTVTVTTVLQESNYCDVTWQAHFEHQFSVIHILCALCWSLLTQW
jgi:hypothetical protein